MIKIKPLGNGCMLSITEHRTTLHFAHTFGKDNLDGLQDLLYDILEHLQPTYSRYDKQKIVITIVHGDKHECKDKKCKICKEGK